jgi:hypothetical protein
VGAVSERRPHARTYPDTSTPAARRLVEVVVGDLLRARQEEDVTTIARNRTLRALHTQGVEVRDLARLLEEAGDPLSIGHVSRIVNAPEGHPTNTKEA